MSAAALNDVIAELTASLARSLQVTTREGYTALCDAVTQATDGWQAERQLDLFQDANGRVQSRLGLIGDPGAAAQFIDLVGYTLHTPLRPA